MTEKQKRPTAHDVDEMIGGPAGAIPADQLVTEPTFVAPPETPEAAEAREAQGLPPPPPPKPFGKFGEGGAPGSDAERREREKASTEAAKREAEAHRASTTTRR
jgi:hypothetical protein